MTALSAASGFVQGVANSPLRNLPALMQQRRELERQRRMEQQARELEQVRMQTTSELNALVDAAGTPEEKEQLLNQGAMGLHSMGFSGDADFFLKRAQGLAEDRRKLMDVEMKREQIEAENRRSSNLEFGRKVRHNQTLALERDKADMEQKRWESEQKIREQANVRDEQQHLLNMEKGVFELDSMRSAKATENWEAAERRLANGWTSITNGGSVEGFYNGGKQVMERYFQQDPELFQEMMGLESHRFLESMDIIPHPETGQAMVEFTIRNTRTGTTGPMTENASAEAKDKVVTVPLSSFNRMMYSRMEGQPDPYNMIRENVNQLFRESGIMAAMPEGRKDQQVAVMDLALHAYDMTGDIRIAEKLAGVMMQSELEQVQAFWRAKSPKQLKKAREDILKPVSPFALMYERPKQSKLKQAAQPAQAAKQEADPRAVMPKRSKLEYANRPFDVYP